MYPSAPDHRPLLVNLLLALALTSLLADPVVAQQPDQTLVSCSAIPGCSSSTGCTVGNATNAFLGATSFNASLPQASSSSSTSTDSVELTWTVGALSSTSSSAADTLFTKNFYLGYPPSLSLASETSFTGCALFFEGIARSISLNGSEYGSMTCSQTLGAQCVSDLLSQAKAQVQSLAKQGGAGDDGTCANLQDTMERNPPQSCWGTAMVTWGSVVAQDLTGPNAPVTPTTEGTCHPSIAGKGYTVALIESQTVRSEDVSSDHAPFFYSVTPVISVFYQSGSEPKAYMSCLKVVDEDATRSGSGSGGVVSTQTSNGASGGGPSTVSLASFAWAILGLGVVILMSGWV